MGQYILSFKPAVQGFGSHDPSAALFQEGKLLFAIEEERFTRRKHAKSQFPLNSIKACLEYENITLTDIDEIVLPYYPPLIKKNIRNELLPKRSPNSSSIEMLNSYLYSIKDTLIKLKMPTYFVKQHLQSEFDNEIPSITMASHHRCHAISAYYYSSYDESLVLTIDGSGEYDSTVVWHGQGDNLTRIRTYKLPNSLGFFFGAVTEFLGFKQNNGEGKVMGLAPYGTYNEQIESALLSLIETGVDYDVTEITKYNKSDRVSLLEDVLDRKRKQGDTNSFSKWEKDLAYTTQKLLENICTDITEYYLDKLELENVCLAGGVALNCKLNKKIMEVDGVDNIFIQPVAHDAGLSLGGGLINSKSSEVPKLDNLYFGDGATNKEIKQVLNKNKIEYSKPDNMAQYIAKEIADGKLVARYSGRMELGPRALGNRSILADPRTASSRDRVNKYVKHREAWRPFAPTILEEAADDYLESGHVDPFMITTATVKPEKQGELEAVLHPEDNTTRPQTVNQNQNTEYYQIINEFKKITGVPVVLNTSFNDHGEPIVRSPTEAIKDFYGMGLDILIMNDYAVEK